MRRAQRGRTGHHARGNRCATPTHSRWHHAQPGGWQGPARALPSGQPPALAYEHERSQARLGRGLFRHAG
eukprot:10814507-Lingulodinium_polyedra.AAC.1